MKNRNEVLQYKVRSKNLHKNQTKTLLRDETIAAAESVSGWRRFVFFLCFSSDGDILLRDGLL